MSAVVPDLPGSRCLWKAAGCLLMPPLLAAGGCWLFSSTQFWSGYPSGADAEEAAEVRNALNFALPPEASGPDQGARDLKFKPWPRYSEILIWGILTEPEREEVCRLARTIRQEKATKPVHLRFYLNGKVVREEIIP